MDLVSSCSGPFNQSVRNMHAQGNSASIGQQNHMSQSLSNMHTNTNTAHYSNQHPFSINMSSGSGGPFMSQSQGSDQQPPASNHPIANPAGQGYNQKSINTTPATSMLPANVAPLVVEPSVPEKSQANGTADGETSPPSLPSQSAFALISKEKTRVPSPPQDMEIEPPAPDDDSLQEVSKKIKDNGEQVSSDIPESPKPIQDSGAQVPIFCSAASAQPVALSVPEKDQDPLHIPEKEHSETPNEPEELIVQKNVESDLDKEESPAKEFVKEVAPETKPLPPVKATPRKTKAAASASAISTPSTSSGLNEAKRQRMRTQHYQSPLPEVEFVSKISTQINNSKNTDEKLIVFYKNEFLAVRNAEGSFFLCQAVQNIYKSSPKIRIRWLSQDKADERGEVYTPDFYDLIDFDCILTNLSLTKADKGKFILPASEKSRTESILNRSLAVEKGEETSPSLTEEHPDGIDVSLYRDEDQLKKRKGKKRPRKAPPKASAPAKAVTKKSPTAPKVQKVTAPAKTAPKKAAAADKPASVAPKKAEPKPVTSGAKTSKPPSRANSKSTTKTSPVVDQKKAKVLARIGKKPSASSATAKAPKNNSKNGKTENKTTAPAPPANKKAAQPKPSTSAARTSRKSARK